VDGAPPQPEPPTGRRHARGATLAAGAALAVCIVLGGALVAIATSGTDTLGGFSDTGFGSSVFGSTGFSGTESLATSSVGTGGVIGGGETPAGQDRTSAVWTGVGIGVVVALFGGLAVVLRRSRPPEATDEGPDFWAAGHEAEDEPPG
jgi:hypothetical protein